MFYLDYLIYVWFMHICVSRQPVERKNCSCTCDINDSYISGMTDPYIGFRELLLRTHNILQEYGKTGKFHLYIPIRYFVCSALDLTYHLHAK